MGSFSGGNPAGMPDFKPLNRSSPEQFRQLLARAVRPPLFQVWVDAAGRGTIPVGPKCPQGVAESFASAIRAQIALGRERTWNNPAVVACGGLSDG